jgi:hypothetical protein
MCQLTHRAISARPYTVDWPRGVCPRVHTGRQRDRPGDVSDARHPVHPHRQRHRACAYGAQRQGLTLVHFSAQSDPLLSLKPPNVSLKKCSRQAEEWTSVQGLIIVHFSAQPHPFLSRKPPNLSVMKCSRQATMWTGVRLCSTATRARSTGFRFRYLRAQPSASAAPTSRVSCAP